MKYKKSNNLINELRFIGDKYNSNKRIWEQSRSGDLYVGDIISIKENETFPADVILIDSNLPEGIC